MLSTTTDSMALACFSYCALSDYIVHNLYHLSKGSGSVAIESRSRISMGGEGNILKLEPSRVTD